MSGSPFARWMPWAVCIALLGISASCDDGGISGVVSTKPQCRTSADCHTNQVCTADTCVDLTGCTPGSCAAGTFCGSDGSCQSIDVACQAGDCRCAIVNNVGQVSVNSSDVAHIVPAGTTFTPTVVFTTASGRPLPLAVESMTVDGSNTFSVQDNQVVSTAQGGPGTLQVSTGEIHCQARLLNTGAAPSDGRVRLSVFDRATGQPVAGAQVVISVADGLVDVGSAPPTDASGLTETALPIADTFTASVFANGYSYLSVVGLSANDTPSLALPLEPKTSPEGGYAGTVDFSPYEKLVTNDNRRPFRFALAGASGPLTSLISTQFSMDSLMTSVNTGNPCTASQPGCLQLPYGNDPNEKMPLLLPGPLVLQATQLADNFVTSKSFFNTAAPVGRRLPYLLGAELDLGFAASLQASIAPLVQALFDPTADLGDTLQKVCEQFVSMLPELAVGLAGGLDLTPVPPQVWADFSGSAGQGAAPQGVVQMDGSPGNLPPFPLTQRAAYYTDATVADFPPDTGLDTLLVLSGVNATGFGFVPLGLGFGLDCTHGACLSPQGNFDGKINGLNLVPAGKPLPVGRPAQTADGHLAFFQAQPFGGLEGQPQATVVIAASLQNLQNGALMSGVVLPEALEAGSSEALANVTYPALPTVFTVLTNRHYVVTPLADSPNLRWVRFGISGGTGPDAQEWQVFVANDAGGVTLPTVPGGLTDLKPNVSIPVSDMALHLADSTTLASLVANPTDGLAGFAKRVRGFASRQQPSVTVPK